MKKIGLKKIITISIFALFIVVMPFCFAGCDKGEDEAGNSVEICYELDGGTNAVSNPTEFNFEDQSYFKLEEAQKLGYEFDGWFLDTEYEEEVSLLFDVNYGEKITLFAKWTPIQYSISYNLEGTNNPFNVSTYTIEDEVNLYDPTANTGYKFNGWYLDESYTQPISKIELGTFGNKILYAKETPIEYTITYVLDGTNNPLNVSNYTVEEEVDLYNPTVADGYVFNGWYLDESYTQPISKIELGTFGNKILYAKETPIEYTITYVLDGTNNLLNVSTYTIEDEVNLYDPTSNTGYKFNGWYLDESYTQPISKIKVGEYGNKIIYAKIVLADYVINYNLDGGYNPDGAKSIFNIESEFDLPIPTKSDYGFVGWYTDAELINPIREISKGTTGNLNLYAKWSGDYRTTGTTFGKLNVITKTEFEIPYYVTNIGEYAFNSMQNLISITIPNSVTNIGLRAFEGCSGLTSITIPNSVTNIGLRAFEGCSGLTSITIPGGVEWIGSYAFLKCSGLTSINVEEGNSKYDSRNNCNAIIETSTNKLLFGCKNTSIPDGIISIEDSAFNDCSGLTSITIPSSVTIIGNSAFNDCSGLTSITIPNRVTSIGGLAFSGCSGLTNITIPSSVTIIGNFAFNGSGLTSINVEEGNSVYDSRNNCNAIIETSTSKLLFGCKNTSIPDGIISIGDSAFSNCSGLTSITIPNSVTNIESYAFSYCVDLTSVIMSNRVTSIGEAAFMGAGFTSITIPNSVTSIGEMAFFGCRKLYEVIFKGTEEEWREIDIAADNDKLLNATIKFEPEEE